MRHVQALIAFAFAFTFTFTFVIVGGAAGCSSCAPPQDVAPPAGDDPLTPVVCADEGVECRAAGDCCSNVCAQGACAAPSGCVAAGDACDTASPCCSNVCTDGVCQTSIACTGIGGACIDGAGCCSSACSDGLCGGAAAGAACQGPGGACAVGADCCAGLCDGSGVCVSPAPVCTDAGTECVDGATCCSGRCEPVQGTGQVQCLEVCFADGAACERALDCCALNCNGGVCGGELCRVEGEVCADAGECCSNVCEGGECAIDREPGCRPTGEDCTSGGPTECCGVCDEDIDRCTFGDETCRGIGVACDDTAQCCHGECVAGGTCQIVCADTGEACNVNSDCCSASCSGSPPVCDAPGALPPPPPPPPGDAGPGGEPPEDAGPGGGGGGGGACVVAGDACEQASECCTGTCITGICLFIGG